MPFFSNLKWPNARNQAIILGLVLFLVLVYWPIFKADYIFFDDDDHFLENAFVQEGSIFNLWRFLFTPNNTSLVYIPLTMLSFCYEQFFGGPNPYISHAINFLLHLCVSALAFLFGRRLGLGTFVAAAGAVVFAIHPVHVESVAWVTERKDVLYSAFYLVSLIFYLRYLDHHKGRDYIFALIAAALSILSKPMALSLPFVLFLIDHYRGRPFKLVHLLEKLPFFLVVEPIALVTYTMNAFQGNINWSHATLVWTWCPAFYIQKFFFPVDLSIMYFVPEPLVPSNPEFIRSFCVLFLFLLLLWRFRSNRLFVFATGFFILSSFFLWRFSPSRDLNIVADRFMYMPSLGFCFLVAAVVRNLWQLTRWRPILATAATAILLSFSVATHLRLGTWENCYRLWGNVARRYPDKAIGLKEQSKCVFNDEFYETCREEVDQKVYSLVGATKTQFLRVYGEKSQDKINWARKILAYKLFLKLLVVAPKDNEAYELVGLYYINLRQYKKAMAPLQKAIELKRFDASHHYHIGLVHHYLGDYDKALQEYYQAVRLDRTLRNSYLNLAKIQLDRKDYSSALISVAAGLEIKPRWAEAYELGFVIALKKKDAQLCDVFSRRLIKLFPERKTSHVARAIYLDAINDCAGGRAAAQTAMRLGYPRKDLKADGLKEGCSL